MPNKRKPVNRKARKSAPRSVKPKAAKARKSTALSAQPTTARQKPRTKPRKQLRDVDAEVNKTAPLEPNAEVNRAEPLERNLAPRLLEARSETNPSQHVLQARTDIEDRVRRMVQTEIRESELAAFGGGEQVDVRVDDQTVKIGFNGAEVSMPSPSRSVIDKVFEQNGQTIVTGMLVALGALVPFVGSAIMDRIKRGV